NEPNQQCLLLARRAELRRHRLRPVLDEHVSAVRTNERASRCSIALSLPATDGAVVILDIHCWLRREPLLDPALECHTGPRKRGIRLALAPQGDGGFERGGGLDSGCGCGNAGFGHDQLKTGEKRIIGSAVLQQSVALAHGSL